jgi:hypothetical protein
MASQAQNRIVMAVGVKPLRRMLAQGGILP